MYSYKWNKRTGGYTLVPEAGRFVASELRPVYAQEMKLVGLDAHFKFDEGETRPICWAKQTTYIYRGEEIAKLENMRYGAEMTPKFLTPKKTLKAVDVEAMVTDPANHELMAALVADTQKRIKEMYDKYTQTCAVAYIGFSGGKDSMLLLDLCHKTLPLSVPVVFSDTDMELSDTYRIWEEVQRRYPDRTFIKAKADRPALDNWFAFGPPSRTIRWCCSVHKSTPAILALRQITGKNALKAQAFLGVRNDESLSRSEYDDIGVGVKNATQVNTYPVLQWGSHELWLYTFAEQIAINEAYKKGLPRVGCVMCPESTEKYAWLVNAIYPKSLKPYNDIILNSIDKEFATAKDRKDYLGTAGWQARKSGETLKNQLFRPAEKIEGSRISWILASEAMPRLMEWLKTLGAAVVMNCDPPEGIVEATGGSRPRASSMQISYSSAKGDRTLEIAVKPISETSTSFECQFETTADLRSFGKYVRQCVNKAIACIGCRSCEVECPTHALRFEGGTASIDGGKCIHCLKCHSADYGCWRYQSMRNTEVSNGELATINKYKNFGLREMWISVYLNERDNFAMTGALGNKMIESGKAWMRQALLMDQKNCTPLKLMEVAERHGTDNRFFWDCIWIALANRAAIVKWFVTATEANKAYTSDDLFSLMGSGIKDATKKGGISAFKDMLTKSPFGTGAYPVVSVVMKGKQVGTMTRVPHAVDDLALLYGLFVTRQQISSATLVA